MKILYAEEFYKRFHKLPLNIQDKFREQELFFKTSWRDPRLHTKKLKGETAAFSFRITREYRVLFMFVAPETALLATIGHRKDVYR
ncbi:MAG: hypothetical protein Q7K39_04520 [Candidatus Magasanikbacteria bacterium]|nr:hypothetical protein [Candidatus Magasanikbacteria bacterium]